MNGRWLENVLETYNRGIKVDKQTGKSAFGVRYMVAKAEPNYHLHFHDRQDWSDSFLQRTAQHILRRPRLKFQTPEGFAERRRRARGRMADAAGRASGARLCFWT